VFGLDDINDVFGDTHLLVFRRSLGVRVLITHDQFTEDLIATMFVVGLVLPTKNVVIRCIGERRRRRCAVVVAASVVPALVVAGIASEHGDGFFGRKRTW